VGEVHRVLGREVILGRQTGADIQVVHPTVSRRHARLVVCDDRVFIEDLGSSNGTLIGIHAVRGRLPVPHGAVVALGSVTLLRVTYSPILSGSPSVDIETARSLASPITGAAYLREHIQAERTRVSPKSPLVAIRFRVEDSNPDTPGTASTDAAMGELAVTICESIRTDDFMARTAAGEFVVVLRAARGQALIITERVRDWLERPAMIDGRRWLLRLNCAIDDVDDVSTVGAGAPFGCLCVNEPTERAIDQQPEGGA
jgi:GGDEF domain-containing protein